MKIVINKCYGGYSLSARAVQRMAELKGRPCFFFTQDIRDGFRSPYIPISMEQATQEFVFWAFDVPDPNELLREPENWHEMTQEARQEHDARFGRHHIDNRPDDRADPDLVRVVEELGDAANGSHAKLKVVEIPDGVEYGIDEYDGLEHVAETHRTWG